MAIGTSTITVYQGQAVNLDFALDPAESIAGWTLQFTVEGSPSVPKLVQKSMAALVEASGTFRVALTAAETAALRPGIYLYEAKRTDAGAETPLAIGDFVVAETASEPAS